MYVVVLHRLMPFEPFRHRLRGIRHASSHTGFRTDFRFRVHVDTRRDCMLAIVCFEAYQESRIFEFSTLQSIPVSRRIIFRIFDRVYLCHYIKNTKRCHRFPCRDKKFYLAFKSTESSASGLTATFTRTVSLLPGK